MIDLKPLRDLLRDPAHWTKYTIARDASGFPVAPFNPDACSFCLYGAISKVFDSDEENEEIDGYLQSKLNGRYLGDFNDDPKTTHADIMELLK